MGRPGNRKRRFPPSLLTGHDVPETPHDPMFHAAPYLQHELAQVLSLLGPSVALPVH